MENSEKLLPECQCEGEIDQTNFYSILQCTSNATLTEIKSNYHRLIKKFHPDKQNQDGTVFADDKFILVDKAFKTLSDEKLRREYDASLLENNFSQSALVYAELLRSELDFNREGIAFYPCRCGHNIEIEKDVLDENELLVECGECTNCILVK